MYEIIQNVIQSGRYELSDMLKKIDTVWVQGEITEEQKTELVKLAQENADPANSYAPLQEQVDQLFEQLGKLESRVTALENNSGATPMPEPEEWPEYVQPSGAHDAYNTGDKITYNGKQYICKMDGCVWSPGTYPQAWEVAE